MNTFGKTPYPNRSPFAPNSGQVQSDDEWNGGWQAKLATIAPTISTSYDVIGGSGPEVNPLRTEANNSLSSSWLGNSAGVERDARQAVWDMASKYGLGVMRNNDGGAFSNGALTGFNPYTDTGRSAMQGAGMDMPSQTYSVSEANPEYTKAQADYAAAQKLRSENQTRQQQAYDTTMMGNGGIGGALPGNYTDPNYGQVTGKVGGLGSLGGTDLTGLGQENQTGAYTGGSGSYNPTPWSAGWQKSNPWGGF